MIKRKPEDYIVRLEVKCDEKGCSWLVKCGVYELKAWHNTPCPECGKGIIVNDEDMGAFAVTYGIASMAAMLGLDPDKCGEPLHMDTSEMRTQPRTPSKDSD